jgi:CheY-like chemotaxis protein
VDNLDRELQISALGAPSFFVLNANGTSSSDIIQFSQRLIHESQMGIIIGSHPYGIQPDPTRIRFCNDVGDIKKIIEDKVSIWKKQAVKDVAILIADDDEFNRKLMAQFLIHEGFQVFLAQNGFEAIEIYKQHTDVIAIVLLDNEMPLCDGPTCAHKLMQHTLKNNIKQLTLFGVTGDITEDTKHRCEKAGMKNVFSKPVKIDLLVNEIFKEVMLAYLRKRGARRKSGEDQFLDT